MVHDREYVKKLLRKQLEGTIAPVEEMRLQAARQLYDEDEFMEMAAEALLASEGGLPDGPLRHWRPDFKRIMAGGSESKRLGPRPKYMQAAAVAAAVVLVLSIGYVLRRQAMDAPLVIGDCTGVNDRMEIPPSEFACTILGSHFPAADIGASYRGTIAEMGNIVVDKAADGIVRLGYRPHGHLPDSGVRYIAITTGARQQCALELPDGTRIRLNAGSAVHYSLAPKPGQPPTLR